ncbi:MAG: cadherin domain-containing protein, partial [Acidimicrobiia bacterium]
VDNPSHPIMQGLYWKEATGSEPAQYSFNVSSTKTDSASGAIAAYSGVDTTNPVDAVAGQANGTSTSIVAPSIVTTQPGTTLIAFFAVRDDGTISPPGTMMERWDVNSSAGVGSIGEARSEGADEILGAAGATGTRTATATASDGSVGTLLALAPSNTPPSASAGGPYNHVEGEDVLLDASGSFDVDPDTLTYAWDLDNDSFYDDATGVSPTITWLAIQGLGIDDDGTHPIAVEVDDGNGGTDTATADIVIANTPPTITAVGTGSASAGSPYTVNLTYSDPGDDSPTQWTIDWGDGTSDVYPGATVSANHPYAAPGLTHGITATVIDDDGTWTNADLVVPGLAAGSTFIGRFDNPSGTYLADLSTTSPVDRPHSVAVGPDGLLYINSYWNGLVLRFDPETNTYVDTFVPGADPLVGPSGIAFGANGNLYVADYDNSVIREYGPTGTPLGVFASGGGLNGPGAIAFGPDGHLYVAGYNSDSVHKYNGTTGAHMTPTFVSSGGNGLNQADGLAIDATGNVYVSSMLTDEVKRWAPDRTYLGNFTSGGSLVRPSGLVFGADGKLYVGSETGNLVKVFDGTTGVYDRDLFTAGTGGLDRPAYHALIPDHWVDVDNNNPPVATDDPPAGTLGVNEGGSITVAVMSNDSDPDLDTLLLDSFTQPPVGEGTVARIDGGTPADLSDDSLRYNAPAEWDGATSFTYTISDGIATDTGTVFITVNEVNVAPVLDPVGPQSGDEGTLISFTATATDSDLPANTLTFTIEDGAGAVPPGAAITAGGAFTWTPTEAQGPGVYSFDVVITDDGTPNLEDRETISITVNDVNEAPTDIALAPSSLDENVAVGTVVGALSTTDPDPTDTHTYALIAGVGDGDNGLFTIVGDELRTAGTLNYETLGSPLNIRVETTDSGAGNLTYEEAFTVTLNDVNEAPTDITLAPATVAENVPVATIVGTVSTSDPDPADTHTYSLVAGTGDGDNGLFTIVGDELRTAAALDYETLGSPLNIRVQTTDSGTGNLTFEETLTVTLTDGNEAPVANDNANGVAEDGSAVFDVKANDIDPEDGIPAGPAAVVTQPLHGTAIANAGGMGTVT